MQEIKEICSEYFQNDEITDEEIQQMLEDLGTEKLAEFILDALNRGWMSRFNLGLREDGSIA